MNAQNSLSETTGSTLTDSRTVPHILLIDDDPDITQAIEIRLKNYDVRVTRRFTGMQGIYETTREMPDLIITDLRMPHGEGEDLLECLQQNTALTGIPVIVLTGIKEANLERRVKQLGACSVLCKPVHYLDLLQEVGKYVELHELDWENLDPRPTG